MCHERTEKNWEVKEEKQVEAGRRSRVVEAGRLSSSDTSVRKDIEGEKWKEFRAAVDTNITDGRSTKRDRSFLAILLVVHLL